ncbi:MAG TPA: protein kinase [Thermoanaerobaculia bacterium]|nr:protein kinase [Thermoanaerobaculia bacterium]
MTLTAGQRLGPYEVVSTIGAGGMGEVYQGRDTRLDRSVAIKVLPGDFSRNAALKLRFEREAKAISALNHPNICTLHDVGSDNGVDYLVMEYIEGESLAQRLLRGPLPLEQVLRYGVQIAGALDAAHRQGIVHRDLKPGNVMLTRSGAKLLDFGLAKESGFRSNLASGAPDMQTEQKALTAEGTMVGTFQYMAPEQLEGANADARTDIFALGTLLYEMTTGVRAFDGKTRTSIIAAIVSGTPAPISSMQPMTPPALEHVIRRCLAKEPDDRWQSAADIASELQWISETGSQVLPAAVRRRLTLGRYLWPAVALIAGFAAGMALWLWRGGDAARSPISHFQIAAPTGPIQLGFGTTHAIAPDESAIVFSGRTGGGGDSALFIRRASSFDAVRVEGSGTAENVVFSPDSRWIAFMSGGKLKKVSVDGGRPVELCELSGGGGGAHWAGSTIYFNDAFSNGIWSVPAEGGEKMFLFRQDPAKQEGALLFPQLLPDGKHLLYSIWRGGSFDDGDIAVRSLESGEQKIILRGGSHARFLPTGHLVYGRGGALLAVPFDPKRLEATGAPVIVLDDVATGTTGGEAQVSFSDRGTILFARGGALTEVRDLVWVTRDGEATPVVATRRNYADPKLSPDGRLIAVTIETAQFDTWVLDIERDSVNRLSFGADDVEPVWSPDGSQVAWTSSRTGAHQIFVRPADGSGDERQLTKGDFLTQVTSWSPDGKTLIYRRRDPNSTRADIWMRSVDEDGEGKPVLVSRFDKRAVLSRDGRWMAVVSDESGRAEIYVTPFPGPGPKVKVSIDGGASPVWSRDGREIYYRQEQKIFATSFDPSRMVSVGRPALLFEGPYRAGFDVGPDGRLLMVRHDENWRTAPTLHGITGWFDELEGRVKGK